MYRSDEKLERSDSEPSSKKISTGMKNVATLVTIYTIPYKMTRSAGPHIEIGLIRLLVGETKNRRVFTLADKNV